MLYASISIGHNTLLQHFSKYVILYLFTYTDICFLYLTTLSASQILCRQMTGLLMNNKVETVKKGTVMVEFAILSQ
jgi:hypothetical protein